MTLALNFARIISVLAASLMLCACGAIKLGYNNIDEVAYWWLDGNVDFENSQRPQVRQDIARLHLWHRGNELPRYVDLLQRMERLASTDITSEQACAFIGDIRERVGVLSTQAEPAAVTLAMSLTPEQLTHLERKYQKINRDYRKEWIDIPPAEQRVKRVKQLVERSETIYGKLADPQREAVRQQVEQSSFDAQRFMVERQRRQQDILQTLRTISSQPIALADARNLVRGYLERFNKSPNATFRAYQDTVVQENCRGIASTHNATTAAQRENAVKRLRSYQEDLRELAVQR